MPLLSGSMATSVNIAPECTRSCCPRPDHNMSVSMCLNNGGGLVPLAGIAIRSGQGNDSAYPGRLVCLPLMLRHIVLDNFKSFAHAEATIAPFTLLVGANGSGKSNFLDALRFLHGIAQGWPIGDVVGGHVEGGTRMWNGIRGGQRETVRAGTSSFKLASDWRILADVYRHVIESDGRTVSQEEIGNLFVAKLLPGSQPIGKELAIEWLPGSSQPCTVLSSSSTSVISTPVALTNGFAGVFAPTLRGIRFLDLQVSSMRNYSDKSRGARLADDGSNLSSVLWTWCQNPQKRSRLVDWVVELCSSEIADIEFDETESGDVLLRVVEQNGSKTTAKSLSDGTLRFLGLLAALGTLGHGETLVIEDLDHGMHPSRLGLLVQAVEETTHWTAERRSEPPTVIATTHSPTLLEAALDFKRSDAEWRASHPESRPASLLLFARLDQGRGSIIRNVRSLPDLAEVRKRRDINYLINTGWLERAL